MSGPHKVPKKINDRIGSRCGLSLHASPLPAPSLLFYFAGADLALFSSNAFADFTT